MDDVQKADSQFVQHFPQGRLGPFPADGTASKTIPKSGCMERGTAELEDDSGLVQLRRLRGLAVGKKDGRLLAEKEKRVRGRIGCGTMPIVWA